MKRKMTTARAQEETVFDRPVEGKKHTLFSGTLGHLRWLRSRENKTLKTGAADLDSVVEICFAYTTDSEALQSFKGSKATAALEKFGNGLTNEEFNRLQSHAETQLLKFSKTSTSPKKPTAQASRKPAARVRKRS